MCVQVCFIRTNVFSSVQLCSAAFRGVSCVCKCVKQRSSEFDVCASVFHVCAGVFQKCSLVFPSHIMRQQCDHRALCSSVPHASRIPTNPMPFLPSRHLWRPQTFPPEENGRSATGHSLVTFCGIKKTSSCRLVAATSHTVPPCPRIPSLPHLSLLPSPAELQGEIHHIPPPVADL